MVDVLSPSQRRYCMSQIRDKDTKPELFVRRILHAEGYRYRLHDKKLPGKPDLVFSSRRKVIFVHGCFWHRHNCRYGRVTPKTRQEFWIAKLQGNRDRDLRNRRELRRLGWDVLVVWECQIKRQEWLLERIINFLESV